MAYDEELAHRIRQTTNRLDNFSEKKMFGGIAFLYKGKMTVGVVGDELMARVIESKMKDTLAEPGVREMDFTGRSMKEFVYVSASALGSEEQLSKWIDLGLEHAKSKVS